MQVLTNQEFTYRQTPATEVGTGTFDSIKGNTFVWNQLVQNGNFADVSAWRKGTSNVSYTVSGNVATVSTSVDGNNFIDQLYDGVIGHKYLFTVDYKTSYVGNVANCYYGPDNLRVTVDSTGTNTWTSFRTIMTASQGSSSTQTYQIRLQARTTSGTFQFRNCMLIDLTQMGLDNLTVEQFTSLFPLSYYDYNQGTLLSFNGNGIKTVGFNQWDEELEQGSISTSTGQNSSTAARCRSKNYIRIIPTKTYYCKASFNVYVFYYDSDYNYLGYVSSSAKDTTFTSPYSNAMYIRFRYDNNGASYNNDVCINISGDKNGTYEPYEEHITSLPTSAYFPTGMKSAGSVYDELTPSKAVTRVGSRAYQSGDENNTSVITDGTNTYYELATPTETSVDLDLTYPIEVGGTEELLPVNGTAPTTAPILADMTYRGLIPVSVNVYPLGSGTVTGSGQYRYKEEVTITATPNDEIYRFLRYEDENGSTLSTNSTYTFKVGD